MKHNRWFMNGFLSKKKVRTQLYTVYVVAVFVPIVIVGIYLFFQRLDSLNQFFVFKMCLVFCENFVQPALQLRLDGRHNWYLLYGAFRFA